VYVGDCLSYLHYECEGSMPVSSTQTFQMCLLWRFFPDCYLAHILLFTNLLYLSNLCYVAERGWFAVGFIEVAALVKRLIPFVGGSFISLDFVVIWSHCRLLVTVEVLVRNKVKFYSLVTYISDSSVICKFLLECFWHSVSRENRSVENFVKSVP
jgi:hypothetical protein